MDTHRECPHCRRFMPFDELFPYKGEFGCRDCFDEEQLPTDTLEDVLRYIFDLDEDYS